MPRRLILSLLIYVALGSPLANAQEIDTWAAQQVGIGGGSSHGPSLAVFQGKLFAAWKGVDNDQKMYWASFDGEHWSNQQVGIGGGTSLGPSLAVFQGKLIAAWKGVDNDLGMYWASFDGSHWSTQAGFVGNNLTPRQRGIVVQTSVGPSLAVFQNKLFAAWKGPDHDDRMFWATFDGDAP